MSYKQTNLPAKSIAEAKRRGKKTFKGMDKSGMRTKDLAAVSEEDMKKAGFTSFGKDSLNRYLMGKGPKKPTTTVTKTPVKKDVDKRKPTTNIFKVKKGESTTKAADAKAKIKKAQKKAGRGLTMKGKPDSKPVYGFPKLAAKVTPYAEIAKKNKKDNNKVVTTNIAGAGAGKGSVDKKSNDKKRKSLFKRITGLASTPESKNKKDKKISDRGRGIFFGNNKKNKKTTSSYNKKTDPTAISYKKGGGNVFVARQYGGKIGD